MRKKLPLIVILTTILSFVTFLVIILSDPIVEHQISANIAWNNPTEKNFERYIDASTNEDFVLAIQEIDDDITQPKAENSSYVYNWLLSSNLENTEDILAVSKEKKKEIVKEEFEEAVSSEENLVEGISLIVPGQAGIIEKEVEVIKIKSKDLTDQKSLTKSQRRLFNEKNQVTYEGMKDREEFKKEISKIYENLMKAIKEESISEIIALNFSKDKNYKVDDERKLENLKLNNTELKNNVSIISDDLENAKVGSLEIKMGNCGKNIDLGIVYDIEEKVYKFERVEEFVKGLCLPQWKKNGNKFIGLCKDCTYLPINKTHGLKSSYKPKVIAITEISGGQSVSPKIRKDLLEMNKAAQRAGYRMHLTSGYRSYQTQAATFEAWVQRELALGYSRATAERLANQYSARPGFSEHQLGTTVDLNSNGCIAFGRECGSNQTLWDWLAKNAHKYGFVLSYPKGKEKITGYSFEPWHYRWIGKELAEEYKKSNYKTTYEFLMARNMF